MVVHVLQFQNLRSRGRRIRRIKASLIYVTSSNQSELHMIMSQYHNLVQDRQTIRSLLLANKEVRGRGYQNSIVFRPAKSKPEEDPRISPSLMASHCSFSSCADCKVSELLSVLSTQPEIYLPHPKFWEDSPQCSKPRNKG